jgi:probable extracellular repeat, HAF family
MKNKQLERTEKKPMKTKILANTLFSLGVIFAFAAVMPVEFTFAARNASSLPHSAPRRYRLIDLGTFGGPNVYFNFSGYANSLLDNQGIAIGGADTLIDDPLCTNTPDCFVSHASEWRHGTLIDLGTLPGGNFSQGFSRNAHGVIAGTSTNGTIDPLTGVFQEFNAVVWQDSQIINLGTLGGNHSVAQSINNRGWVVGMAQNAIPDPVPIFPDFLFGGLQNRAFLWQNGVMQDLGTLGGPDSFAIFVNDRGLIAGLSYTNSTPNPVTGLPTTNPFLWSRGRMQDLGTLGGNYGEPRGLNEQGQVAGFSDLAGDLTNHAFLWERGVMHDLGTLGGDNSDALGINNGGEVIGAADLPSGDPDDHHAFLWRNGAMIDLGTLGSTSVAVAINSRGQVVGHSRLGAANTELQHAFLWENGGPMVDLNDLIFPSSNAVVKGDDIYINDRGAILASGSLPNGDVHAFLLIPNR